jgi:hypothetical protein
MRRWSDLDAAERERLLAAYRRVVDAEGPTCDFAIKLERMQRWLARHGVSITEEEIRGKRRDDSGAVDVQPPRSWKNS